MCQRHSASRRIIYAALFAGAIASAYAAVPQWWQNGFANRKKYMINETASIHRTNCAAMIDISDLVGVLNDKSGADIRVVMGEYTYPKPCKVLTDDAGNAKYLLFTYTLWTSAKPTNAMVYYNYNKFCGMQIPEGRPPVPFSRYRQSDTFFTNVPNAVYLMKVGVYGGVGGTLDFIRSTLNFDYDLISSVPTNKWSYDVIVHNHEYVSNYGTNIITNYRIYMSQMQEVFSGTGSGGGGIVSGNTYGGQTSSERVLHNMYPLSWEGLGYYRSMQIWLTNTNSFISRLENTNVLLLDWANGLCRWSSTGSSSGGNPAYGSMLDMHISYTYGTNDKITNTNICQAVEFRDFRNSANAWANNGRMFICGHLTNVFMMTPAGKRIMQRGFIWAGGMDYDVDLPASSNVTITPDITEYGTFVKALYISNQGMVLKGSDIQGAVYYFTNMQTALTPAVVLRNTVGSDIAINFEAGKSGWSGGSVYAFSGKYAGTVPVGKYLLVVRTNVVTVGGLVGSNDFTFGDVYYGERENADKYRCIPMVICRNKPELYQTTITMNFGDTRKVTAGVYSKNGVLVRTLVNGAQYVSGGVIRWDGVMDNLVMAPMGLYLIKLDIEREGVFYSRVRVLE